MSKKPKKKIVKSMRGKLRPGSGRKAASSRQAKAAKGRRY